MREFPKYSIVIPAYNESARIPATLESVVAAIRANEWPAEVIVVNDGSTDSTARLVRDFAVRAPEVRLLENPGNRGKGYSVRAGILQRAGRNCDVHRCRSFGADGRGWPPVCGHCQWRRYCHWLALAGERTADPPPAALPADFSGAVSMRFAAW